VQLADPPDGGVVDWDGWAGEFVTDYCVGCHSPAAPCFGSGCHSQSPGSSVPSPLDFTQKSVFVANAPLIRCGISVEQQASWSCGSTPLEEFPLNEGSNPMPTDEQRAIMVAWISAGCP
jgi:hypothetical protein